MGVSDLLLTTSTEDFSADTVADLSSSKLNGSLGGATSLLASSLILAALVGESVDFNVGSNFKVASSISFKRIFIFLICLFTRNL